MNKIYMLERFSRAFPKSLFNTPLFYIGLIIKVACAFTFSGYNLKEYFLVFVSYFIENSFQDPYQHFIAEGINEIFPYPAGMLYILSTPFLIFGSSLISKFFLIRLPLLAADIGTMLLLNRLMRGKEKRLLILYWLSPVMLYIIYLHGQLDILPIFFLLLSLHFLFKQKIVEASIFLGIAFSIKTNILMVCPFFLLYIYKMIRANNIVKIAISLVVIAAVFLLINFNYLFSESFFQMVFENREQVKLWDFNVEFGENLHFYLIPFLYILLLAKAIRYEHLSKDLFILFIGFVFSLILLFIPPKPGWYVWILPFLIYFYVREFKLPTIPFYGLQLAYLLYFAVIPESDYLVLNVHGERETTKTIYEGLMAFGIDSNMVVDLSFTLLQTLLFLNVYWIYKQGISKSLKARIRNVPCIIGIGGDSGAGKSTLTGNLQKLFLTKNTTVIRGDDMHKWERGHEKWSEYTHLSPKANDLYEEISQLKVLKSGKKIMRKHYDHDTGKFTEPLAIYPNKIIVFEGLHPFYISAKRELFDIKIFVQPEEDLRLYWKVKRDQSARGYTRQEIIESLEKRSEDSDKYIKPQSEFADITISYFAMEKIDYESMLASDIKLGLKLQFGTYINIEGIINDLMKSEYLDIYHFYEKDSQIIELRGEIEAEDLKQIAFKYVDHIYDIIENPIFQDGYEGFIQLFVLYYISEKF